MSFASASFHPVRVQPTPEPFPPHVERLFPREREIATIVYERGLVTARDIEHALCGRVSNAAIRSMLGRLVRKGVLTQQKYGARGTFIYAPALTAASAREMALSQFAADFCEGSISRLADAIAEFFAWEQLQLHR